eukprot:6178385-Pleurochrysis_carterae.AAC.2
MASVTVDWAIGWMGCVVEISRRRSLPPAAQMAAAMSAGAKAITQHSSHELSLTRGRIFWCMPRPPCRCSAALKRAPSRAPGARGTRLWKRALGSCAEPPLTRRTSACAPSASQRSAGQLSSSRSPSPDQVAAEEPLPLYQTLLLLEHPKIISFNTTFYKIDTCNMKWHPVAIFGAVGQGFANKCMHEG